MSPLSAALRHLRSHAVVIALAIIALLSFATAALLAEARLWHEDLRAEERLLPGTVLGGVEVGGMTVADAESAIGDLEAQLLETPLAVVVEEDRWERTALELGASTTAAAELERAATRAAEPSLTALLRARWLEEAQDGDVTVELPSEGVDAFAAELDEAIDRVPEPASLEWRDGDLVLHEHVEGLDLDRDETSRLVHAALLAGDSELALPVEHTDPPILTADLEAVQPAVADAVVAALDHSVTVTFEDRRWTTSPRELDASPDVQAVVEAALAGLPADGDTMASAATTVTDAGALARASLALPDEAVTGFVDGLADEVDISAVDATLDTSSGWVEITPSRPGRAVDRAATATALSAALAGETTEVDLVVRTSEPSVTAGAYDQVLLVRHGDRRLYLYDGGEIVRDWPVAIGAAGHDTPTGRFTVGAKRHLPTWTNPSPDGWGADMPERIEPGPDNPLGLRAINWNRGGADTLIRFHGTPNAASIGEAASKGCVRMFNSDVVELYDLVRTGSTIVSLR